MTKTKSMSRNQKHGVAPWSDLDHDVLLLVMMQLGVVDFLAFSGVCKSWRSLSLNNRSRFMASRPPMYMFFCDHAYEKICYLQDGEGRKFKTILPHSGDRTCVGLTCGYMILYGDKTHDFWLVNPITRHELHFPNVSFHVDSFADRVTAILVYSPSLSASVFVITNIFNRKIWFSIEGKGVWNHVSAINLIFDLHAFKGKIYTLNAGDILTDLGHICELTLDAKPKLTVLKTKNFPEPSLNLKFVSSVENLYVMDRISEKPWVIRELDFGEMKWVSCVNTEYAFFIGCMKSSAAVKPLSWANYYTGRFVNTLPTGKVRMYKANVWYSPWYFPHECFNVNRLEL